MKPHQHQWSLVDSRKLHGVEPPTTVKDWRCRDCNATKQTEHPRETQ